MSRIEKIPMDLMVASATLASNTLTLVWDKPIEYSDIIGCEVFQNE